jgi:hypothetical protein
MDVEMPVTPMRHEAFAVQAHEPGIAEKLDASLVQRIVENCVELLARSEVLVIDDEGGDEGGFGAQQSLRARHVRHHEHDLGWIVMGFAGLDQCAEI